MKQLRLVQPDGNRATHLALMVRWLCQKLRYDPAKHIIRKAIRKIKFSSNKYGTIGRKILCSARSPTPSGKGWREVTLMCKPCPEGIIKD
jgi:hypothetical protein